MPDKADTRAQILDVAQHLVQVRGYNAVSYSDIGTRLGLRNASLHYHFPTKTDLGVALVRRYRERLEQTLGTLGAGTSVQRLEHYVDAYRTVVHEDGRICLCTVLAAEDSTLPEPMRAEVRAFLDLNEHWLTGVLDQGQHQGELRFPGAPAEAAAAFLATLEGAMILARTACDVERFARIARRTVDALRAA
ncbi:TetR/AcrR family transcriptional regulator [Deinococcus hohokamensis]|uniref:TetR/AcrR family transcriptional regulator n=1 Tax=Deinococcus hohokamensis TaxID=309883 RepID=A0ABV9I7Y1_9DEIO